MDSNRFMKKIDQQAFHDLFNKHYEQLVKVAYSVLSDIEHAEDVVQEVFIKFWERQGTFKIEKSVFAYLKKATILHAIDHLRKAKMIDEHVTKAQLSSLQLRIQTPETELLNKENLYEIYKKIEELPDKSKLIFKLSRFEHLSYSEIAVQLEMSVKSIEYHISKALEILRKSVFGVLVISLVEIN